MFDFRYHALSLSAVIVALVLGVLLGVAIGDRGLVSSGEKGLRKSLRADVVSAKNHASDLQSQLNDRNNVLNNQIYPLLVGGRLQGDTYGIVFLGPKSTTDKNLVSDAVQVAGGHLAWVLAFHEPLDAQAIADRAAGTQYAQLAQDPSLYFTFGVRVGVQLVDGGQLIKRERATLSDSFDGGLAPVQTIVLVHDPPTGLKGADATAASQFEKGVVAGMTDSNAIVVGVQTQTTKPPQAKWFSDQGLTYVSDLDEVEGQISLIYGLAGSNTGSFGRGKGEQLLPDVPTGG